jgi:hypothetical protein
VELVTFLQVVLEELGQVHLLVQEAEVLVI